MSVGAPASVGVRGATGISTYITYVGSTSAVHVVTRKVRLSDHAITIAAHDATTSAAACGAPSHVSDSARGHEVSSRDELTELVPESLDRRFIPSGCLICGTGFVHVVLDATSPNGVAIDTKVGATSRFGTRVPRAVPRNVSYRLYASAVLSDASFVSHVAAIAF